MIDQTADTIDAALERLPRRYPGPGGACAVLHRGQVLVRHTWGWANAERRIPFTPRSLFRLCSITKQFTCGVLLDRFADPSLLDADVAARLPLLQQPAPKTLHLCHNQSGLRDYWAVAMLHGAPAESAFGDLEAGRVIAGTRTLQFSPGTRYSYVNQNFRILSDILQERTGRGFGELLRKSLFEPAAMTDAILAADTRSLPDGTVGYEGTQQSGFRPAVNQILWTGDAGLAATLDDMIAWERHIDATREDAGSIYRRLSAPVTFADGAEAGYGFGLSRRPEFGLASGGHGGALRGWRSHRLYVPSERISVVIFFNHLSDAHAAAVEMLAAALGVTCPPRTQASETPAWAAAYLEPETGLAARIDRSADGELRLRFGHAAERLEVEADGTGASDSTVLRAEERGLWMQRRSENQRTLLIRRGGPPTTDVAGRYRCGELDAELNVVSAGGVLYGAFSGFLGAGRMELLEPAARDLWMLPCPRALDHTPPGDWTLDFQRDASGRVVGAQVGCWLARGLRYSRI